MTTSQLQDTIAQADWLCETTGYADIETLFKSDPALFDSLAESWRLDAAFQGYNPD